MKTWRTGYKVVDCFAVSGELRSYCTPTCAGAVVYPTDGRAARPLPGCGPLCVWATEHAARLFTEGSGWWQIWACKYRPSRARKIWYRRPTGERHTTEWRSFADGQTPSPLALEVVLLGKIAERGAPA